MQTHALRKDDQVTVHFDICTKQRLIPPTALLGRSGNWNTSICGYLQDMCEELFTPALPATSTAMLCAICCQEMLTLRCHKTCCTDALQVMLCYKISGARVGVADAVMVECRQLNQ